MSGQPNPRENHDSDTQSYDDVMSMAKEYLAMEDLDNAGLMLSEALEMDDRAPDAYYGRWVLELKRQHYQDAVFPRATAEKKIRSLDAQPVDYAAYYEMAGRAYAYGIGASKEGQECLRSARDCLDVVLKGYPLFSKDFREIPESSEYEVSRQDMASVFMLAIELSILDKDKTAAKKAFARLKNLDMARKANNKDPRILFMQAKVLEFKGEMNRTIRNPLDSALALFEKEGPSGDCIEALFFSAYLSIDDVYNTSSSADKEVYGVSALKAGHSAVEVAQALGDNALIGETEARYENVRKEAEEAAGVELRLPRKTKPRKLLPPPKSSSDQPKIEP